MGKPSLTTIIPARDEAGTIRKIIKLFPSLKTKTEIIFVEGHSSDETWIEIANLKETYKGKLILKAYKQHGWGKANAVELGFRHATGDILVILDADLSVDPKELSKFYKSLANGKYQFANGSRFVYPKERGAMRYINHIGNIFFSWVFTILLRQRVTDTLCGTKALWRKDYKRIMRATSGFRRNDPYGDFTLFLGAALLNLRIIEIPVSYKARIYGKTKISRFRDGLKLLMVLSKALKKFTSEIS